MMFSPQTFYCNACGRRLHVSWSKLMGREFKVCSPECIGEMELRRARSILGNPEPEETPKRSTP